MLHSLASDQLVPLVWRVDFAQAMAPASYTNSLMPAIATGSLIDQIPAWGAPQVWRTHTLTEELAEQGYDCGLWTDDYA